MAFPALLAIGAATLYAASSVLIRRGLHGSNPHAGIIFSLLTNTAILWAAFLITLPLTALLNWKAALIFAIAGILAPGIARMLRYTSLEKIGVARTGPISASSPIISTSIAIIFLGEKVTLPIVFGTFMIIAGVLIASRRELDTNRADMLFALGAAALAGVSLPIRKYGLTLFDSPVMAGVITASVALALALILISLGGNIRKVHFKDSGVKFYLIAGACTSAAFLLNYTALAKSDVAVIGPLIQTSPIFALIFSHMFINHLEKVNKEVWAGTLVAVTGAVLVGASS
ncbi:DMT family transporter [Candidatus Woesearchaeota archaeon]|nr:DMT family transporter [Candidatus Woesearchaeota archaeon]